MDIVGINETTTTTEIECCRLSKFNRVLLGALFAITLLAVVLACIFAGRGSTTTPPDAPPIPPNGPTDPDVAPLPPMPPMPDVPPMAPNGLTDPNVPPIPDAPSTTPAPRKCKDPGPNCIDDPLPP